VTDEHRSFSLHDTLLHKQDVLVASLGGLRDVVNHGGGRGDVSETEWLSVIGDFLPRRYCVSGKTEVIDYTGNVSQQIDLVIHDRHFCPLFFEQGGITQIPSESVFAVFEVKPALDKGVIEYAMEKAASVRALERTNVSITDRGESRPPRPPFEIVAGVLALESDWNPPFGTAFENALKATDPTRRLQLGCALKHGAFEVIYDDLASSSRIEAAAEGALVFLLMRLFAKLQIIGSPMAIDLRAYTQSLQVEPEGIDGVADLSS
jgi:hypothetical protein